MKLRKIISAVLAIVTVLSLSCAFCVSAEESALLERTANKLGTGMFSNWYNAVVESKQDADGTVYVHATPNFDNSTKQLNFDTSSSLSVPYTDGVYYKAVVRTNVSGTPIIKVGSKDSSTSTSYGVSAAPNCSAESALVGNGEWEEILIPVTVAGGDTIVQMWSYLTGGIINISNYASDAYIDVAAWGLFADKATAQSYSFDLGKKLTTVYVSESGDDAADGKTAATAIASIETAYNLVADGGTIIVSGSVTLPKVTISSGRVYGIIGAEGKSITIKGSGSTSDKITSGRVTVYGNPTIENINLDYTDNTGEGILIFGNNLTIGENVTITHPNTADGNNNLIQNHDSIGKPAQTQGGFESTVTVRSGSIGNMSLGAMYGTLPAYIEGKVTYNIGEVSGDTPNIGCVSQNVNSRGATNYALFKGDARVNVKAGTVGTLAVGNANSVGGYVGLRLYTVDGGDVGKIYTTGNSGDTIEMSGVTVIEVNGGNVGSIAKRGDDTAARVVIFNNGTSEGVTLSDNGAIIVKASGEGKVSADITAPTLENSWSAAYNGLNITTSKKYVIIDGTKSLATDVTGSLYTSLTAGEHTVVFTDNESVTVTVDGVAGTYEVGDTINLPAAPAHENAEHYTFKWTDGTNDYDASAEYTVTGNATITAKWTAKNYTVTIDGTAGTYAYGEKVNLPAAPSHENAEHYTFKWTDGTNDYDAGAQYTVAGNATITAKWTAKNYTVTINGADEAHIFGDKITLGADPNPKTDYVFRWHDETNGVYYSAGDEYTVSGNAVIVPTWNYTGAKYILEGSYNGASAKYTVDVYFENAKVQSGTFGFKYNPDIMTFESASTDFVLTGEYTDPFVDDRTNGIYVNRWVSTETPGADTTIDATAGKVKIAQLVFAMPDHSVFTPETDFTAAVIEEKDAIYMNGKYLAILADVEGLELQFAEILTMPLTEVTVDTYSVTGKVVTSRDGGYTPYDGAEYSSRARITLLNNAGTAISVIYEAADTNTAEFTFTFDAVAPGTYDIKIEKNGYKTYVIENFTVVDSDIDVLNAVLMAGDIKGAFADYCGNGVIDIEDFIRVIRGLDDSTSEVFRQVVDINEDRTVSIADIALIKTNYGK